RVVTGTYHHTGSGSVTLRHARVGDQVGERIELIRADGTASKRFSTALPTVSTDPRDDELPHASQVATVRGNRRAAGTWPPPPEALSRRDSRTQPRPRTRRRAVP